MATPMVKATTRPPFLVDLHEDEWRLIRSLRGIPASPLRDRMSELIEALVWFAANPGCPQAQADGAPCSNAQMACERCAHAFALLDELRRGVRKLV